MRKILILLLGLMIIVGCSRKSVTLMVSDYLNLYRTLDSRIMEELDKFVDSKDLSEENRELYKDAIIREYNSIDYEILSETYKGEYAYVNVRLTVLDLYKIQKDSLVYLNNNVHLFSDENGVYKSSLYTKYKLKRMNETTETVSYEAEFKLLNNGDNWELIQPSNDVLEKIHGIYNYEE
ncbi:MAG: hypothetical protein IJ475_02190 [Bacilli bacterium]|nr:hypothetical protein [Bacilli bacterium]